LDVIYTDVNRIDKGVLHSFSIDYDATETKDFVITVGMDNDVMQGGCWWYVDGTEYGGIVDSKEIVTSENTINYKGRNFRAILESKVIQPPTGTDYKIVYGNLATVVNGLLNDAGIGDIFVFDKSNINISSFQFARYTDLYSGIVAMASSVGKYIALKYREKDRKIHIQFEDGIDYTNEKEYNQDDVSFRIEQHYRSVNHLICLGKGELKDRTVVHLYTDSQGNIGEQQTFFGIEERETIFEDTSAESRKALKEGGIKRLEELKYDDTFEVTVPDREMKIGDIIGGRENKTGIYVKRAITNVIATIDDVGISIDYKVGENSSKSSSSGGSSSGSSSPPYNLPIASSDVLGGVKIGNNLTIGADGKVSAPAPTPAYTLPTASPDVLGGVKIGNGLTIENGILSTSGGGGSITVDVLVSGEYIAAYTIELSASIENYDYIAIYHGCKDITTNEKQAYILKVSDVVADGYSETVAHFMLNPYSTYYYRAGFKNETTIKTIGTSQNICIYHIDGIKI